MNSSPQNRQPAARSGIIHSYLLRGLGCITVAACVSLLSGCSIKYNTYSGKTVKPKEAPYSYKVPEGFSPLNWVEIKNKEGKVVKITAESGDMSGVALDYHNIIWIQVLDIYPYDTKDPAVIRSLDRGYRQGVGNIAKTVGPSKHLIIDGWTALKYRLTEVAAPTDTADSDRIFLNVGAHQIIIHCQWKQPDKKREILRGCNELLSSLKVHDPDDSGEKVAPKWAPYSYYVPENFSIMKKIPSQAGESERFKSGVVFSRGNAIEVYSMDGRIPGENVTLKSVMRVLEKRYKRGLLLTSGTMREREQFTVAGWPAIKYKVEDLDSQYGHVDANQYFVFSSPNIVSIKCYWKKGKPVKDRKQMVLDACKDLIASMKIA